MSTCRLTARCAIIVANVQPVLGSTPKKDEGSGKESAEDVHRHSAEEQKSTLSSVEDVSMSDIMLADLMPHVRKSVESLTALNETVREEMVHPAGVPRYVAEYAVEVLNALKPLTDQNAYLQKLAGSIDTMADLVDEDDPGEAPDPKCQFRLSLFAGHFFNAYCSQGHA